MNNAKQKLFSKSLAFCDVDAYDIRNAISPFSCSDLLQNNDENY